jgi:hypothetical protein
MFKKMITLVAALGFLTSVTTVSSFADGADSHSGIYFGVTGSAIGIEMDGKESVATDANNANSTTGTAGKFALIGGGELGYSFAMGDTFLIDLGYSMVPGEAKLKADSSDTTDDVTDATMTIDNYQTFYIAPTFAVTDSAALYFKLGYTEADVAVTGDISKPADLEGTTFGIGSRTQFGSGLYVRTEAGYTEFDAIKATGLGTNIATTTSYNADPTAAYGAVTLGFKF